MVQQTSPRQRNHWKIPGCIAMLLALISVVAYAKDVHGQQMATVRVLFEWTGFNDCDDDPLSGPDIYNTVSIDGVWQGTPVTDSSMAPFYVGKEISRDVNVSSRIIPIEIRQLDDDTDPIWGINDPDECDINPGERKNLVLSLDLATCQITGDVSGTCGTTIEIRQPGIFFQFKITVEEPPHEAGLNIRCLHDAGVNRIWPQPGDAVTITAEALDGAGNAMPGVVDDIEIWVDSSTTAPAATTSTTPGSFGANTLVHNFTPAAGANQISYRCRVNDGGQWVSTGWRIVQIGQPARGRTVPVLYTGVPPSRLDMVFIYDGADYTGPTDPQFLSAVSDAIRDAFYAGSPNFQNGGLPFLVNQDAMNFWIALDPGHALPFDPNTSARHFRPPGWDTVYGFADTGAIIHQVWNPWERDYALYSWRIFSATSTNVTAFLHEAGHSPIGLADEYCCDSAYFGGYPHPNIYSDASACLEDPLAAGISDACQPVCHPATGQCVDWYRVEPAATLPNDLMGDSGDHRPNAADRNRIDWYFGECHRSGC